MASRVSALFFTSVGKKSIMAVSGLVLFGFVLVHMIGNMKLFLGPESLNHYAHWLREVGYPVLPHGGALWIFRIGLLFAVLLHIGSATELTMRNRRARPHNYKRRDNVQSDYAARTMRWGGVILLLFVIYHLAHFTGGAAWAHSNFIGGDPYHNVVTGFQVLWVSLFYIVAQIALGFHLYHGLWSMFQTLGFDEQSKNSWRRQFAIVFAVIVSLGNISFPVAVLAGIVG